MLKKIIQIADIHIRKNNLHEEHKEVLNNFINDIKLICESDDVLICVLGDIFDSFCEITNEQECLVSWFLKELDKLAPTFVIAGNHDMSRGNVQKLDSLTPLFTMIDFEQTKYLDMELEYNSGIIEYDEKYSFALYSIFSKYAIPDVQKYKIENPDKVLIGLFHGPIINSMNEHNYSITEGVNASIFDECDFVLMGDIHKPQVIKSKSGVRCYYSGSCIQKTFGETIAEHGYSIISLPDFKIERKDIENPYKLYSFTINNVDDIENNREILKNSHLCDD
jgi:DNA repair exonuclease SbcCD nuclease subunit